MHSKEKIAEIEALASEIGVPAAPEALKRLESNEPATAAEKADLLKLLADLIKLKTDEIACTFADIATGAVDGDAARILSELAQESSVSLGRDVEFFVTTSRSFYGQLCAENAKPNA